MMDLLLLLASTVCQVIADAEKHGAAVLGVPMKVTVKVKKRLIHKK